MNTIRKSRILCTTMAVFVTTGTLLLSTTSSWAQNSTTNWMSFDTGAGGWALPAWGGQGAGSAWDSSQDHTGNGGGSLYCIDNYTNGDQFVDLGWMSGSAWDSSKQYDLAGWTNIVFWVKWDTANSTEGISTFNGSPGETPQFWGGTSPDGGANWTWITIGTFTIPDAASNGWVQVNVPIDPVTAGINANMVLGLKKWTGTGNTGQAAFWIDDITLQGSAAIAPPAPTVSIKANPVKGLKVIALSGPYNREQLMSVSDQGWNGASGPVSYSFTIGKAVDGSGGAQYQNHIFLVPSPGTESSPDWNEPNTIFLDLESQADGSVQWLFRCKTNEPNGNTMMYGAGTLASITNATGVGTWTVTFQNGTDVTMTGPGGINSTNFSFDPGWNALFTSPITAYFGCQANNNAGIGQYSVLTEIKTTGTPNPIDDVFTADNGTINTNIWTVNSVDPAAVSITPNNAAAWLKWSLPATGFSPVSSPTITGPYSELNISPLQVSGEKWALLNNNQVPGFFKLVKRSFTQLQVLFPGETNAPNTLTGKVGTPDPASLSAGAYVNLTIHAVDSTWHIVNVSGDNINLTSTDTSAVMPLDAPLANGTLTNTVLFFSQGNWTVTATDTSNTNIPPATSSSITVQQ